MIKLFTPFRNASLVLIFLAVGAGNGQLQAQVSHQVAVVSNTFTPKLLTIHVGDTVVWRNTQGSHNVNGKTTTFPNNPASFGNSVGTNWTYSFVFTITGTYDYQCDPHAGFGMTGKITVLSNPVPPTLTVDFVGMSPHVGEKLTFFVKEMVSGKYADTVTVDQIPGPDFQISTSQIKIGTSYYLDFYADHNKNGVYDAPPVDHAWRIELNDVKGDTTLTFTHNTSFTDIFAGSSGIRDLAVLREVRVYPNPVVDQVYIDIAGNGLTDIQVSIQNALGSLVFTRDFPAGQEKLVVETGDLAPGIYFLSLKSGNEIRNFRLIRQ